ncbi:MAG: class I SAM-dependent methyltransferase [Planctomycetes bacterium]|nr:class I SAM-dependent methyltransferase [Planctomycetota bacterium]
MEGTRRDRSAGAGADAIADWNRTAWNRQVARGNRWTQPVDAAAVAAARRGDFSVVLTPSRPVPRDWFPPLAGLRVLGLASGGGQQMPLLAAAGATVTLHDLSPAQLAQDRAVAEREGLAIRLEEGDMRDLSRYPDGSFDLLFHPCSNSFIPDPQPVWREAFRVLAPGGVLMSGLTQPVRFLFDEKKLERGEFEVRHSLPYSDFVHLSEAERAELQAADEPWCFGHTLEQQLGGQLEAGFVLTALFEDRGRGTGDGALDERIACYLATRAVKPR